MKIAVSATHCTGKTTLVEALHGVLPTSVSIDEPYRLLVDEGHQFPTLPDLEGFELQLERSIQLITDSEEDSVFDRWLADMLAYLITHPDSKGSMTRRGFPAAGVLWKRSILLSSCRSRSRIGLSVPRQSILI
jgi:hypothetical protein